MPTMMNIGRIIWLQYYNQKSSVDVAAVSFTHVGSILDEEPICLQINEWILYAFIAMKERMKEPSTRRYVHDDEHGHNHMIAVFY